MKKSIVLVLALVFASLIMTGCGETFNGISKDVQRVGKGVKTIFVRDTE